MRQIILADRYDAPKIIKEQKELWVLDILLMLGASQEDLESGDPVELMKYGIEVWDHLDNGDVEILQNNVLVGKWYSPKLVAKYDEKQNIYYEIQLDYDSVQDNEFHSPGEDD